MNWIIILGSIVGVLFGIGYCAKCSMKYAWSKKKEELEELKKQLEAMEELTEELTEQKEEIEELLNNEFRDFGALFKQKKNID